MEKMAEVEINHCSFSSHAASGPVTMIVISMVLGCYFKANKSSGSITASVPNKAKLTSGMVRNRFQQTDV